MTATIWNPIGWRTGTVVEDGISRGDRLPAFSFDTVWKIVGAAVGIAVLFWTTTSGLRSDVRDILTRMTLQAELAKAQGQLQEERMAAIRAAVEAMQRRQELQQYEIQQLKETILKQRSFQ